MEKIEGTYFDGHSAKAHDAEIFPRGTTLEVKLLSGPMVYWKVDDVKWENISSKRVRLRHGLEVFNCQKSDFRKIQRFYPDHFQTFFVRKNLIPMLGILLVLVVLGLQSVDVLTKLAGSLISHDQEKALFANHLTKIKKQDCSSQEDKDLLLGIQRDLLDETPYEVIIIPMSQPNAFAFPGGVMVFTTGFFDFIERESEIYGVMAHEIQHIKKRHHIKGFLKQFALKIIFSAITGGDVPLDGGVNLLKRIAGNKYHVEDEIEADIGAIKLLQDKGYSAKGMSDFFNRLEKKYGSNKLTEFFSTHPSNEKRIEYMRPFSNQKDPSDPKVLNRFKEVCRDKR